MPGPERGPDVPRDGASVEAGAGRGPFGDQPQRLNRVVCHIGTYKTGTSSLQQFLRDHDRTLLRPHGFRFPRGWLRRDNHLEINLALLRPDRLSTARTRKDEWRDPGFRQYLVDQVRADLRRHEDKTTIISGEANSMLRYDDELEALRELLGDALIVVYWRDPTEWLASIADQLVKTGIPLGDDPDAFNYVGSDSWQVDYETRTAAWRRHFTDVVALDYDEQVARDGSVIPSFLKLLGLRVPTDAHQYWMNRRGEPGPRVDGNRWANGLAFGESPAESAPRATAATPSRTPL